MNMYQPETDLWSETGLITKEPRFITMLGTLWGFILREPLLQ